MLIDLAGLVLILLFRLACLGRSLSTRPIYERLVSGLWLGVAAWIAGAILQAWVPLWEMLVVGLVLASSAWAAARITGANVQYIADFLAVCALAWLSVIPVRALLVTTAAVAFATAGFVLDGVTMRQRRWLQPYILAVPFPIAVILFFHVRHQDIFGPRLQAEDPASWLRLALVAPKPGRGVTLPSGAAAWLLKNPSGDPRGLAILLHGNDPLASRQPAAVALQGALERSGYDVLSVDHPGFGGSPVPNAAAGWSEWDPTIGPKEALAYVHSTYRPNRTVLVAHSMGVDVALKWLADGADLEDAYLFAGSIDRPMVSGDPQSEDRWIRQFHSDRGMPCCMRLETMRTIRDRFYSGADHFATSPPQQHVFVHFVRFGIEFQDVARVRDALYAAISAPKAAYDLPGVTHFFNTLTLWRFILVDTGAMVRTAMILAAPDKAGTTRQSSLRDTTPDLQGPSGAVREPTTPSER